MSSRFASWDQRNRRRGAEVVAGLADDSDLPALSEIAEAHSGVAGGWAERLGADLTDEGRALFAVRVNLTVAGYDGRTTSPRRKSPPQTLRRRAGISPAWS